MKIVNVQEYNILFENGTNTIVQGGRVIQCFM